MKLADKLKMYYVGKGAIRGDVSPINLRRRLAPEISNLSWSG